MTDKVEKSAAPGVIGRKVKAELAVSWTELVMVFGFGVVAGGFAGIFGVVAGVLVVFSAWAVGRKWRRGPSE